MAKSATKKEETLIEELKYENQMNNLQPRIKAIYKQTKKDPANPSGWSKWSLRPSRKIESVHRWGVIYAPLDGGGKQECLDNLIDLDENKNWEKFGLPLCYPFTYRTFLTNEEKRFVLLCNQVLNLEFTEEQFLKMSEADKKDLRDRVIGA